MPLCVIPILRPQPLRALRVSPTPTDNYIFKTPLLAPSLNHPESEIDPAIQELLGFWKEEIYLNPICKAALDDYQHTCMIATQNRIESESKASSRELSEEETHRQDDIKTLTMLMEAFCFRLMDEFSRDMPDFVHTLVVGSYDGWTEILNASDFYIHDEHLRIAIANMYSIWREAILLGTKWDFPTYGCPNRYKFEGLDDLNPKPGKEKAYHELATLRMKLQGPLKTLGTYIRSHYPIDLRSCALKVFHQP